MCLWWGWGGDKGSRVSDLTLIGNKINVWAHQKWFIVPAHCELLHHVFDVLSSDTLLLTMKGTAEPKAELHQRNYISSRICLCFGSCANYYPFEFDSVSAALLRQVGPDGTQEWPVFSAFHSQMLWVKREGIEGGNHCAIFEIYIDLLTNDRARLCTLRIICADLHPTVEVHLKRAIYITMSVGIHIYMQYWSMSNW